MSFDPKRRHRPLRPGSSISLQSSDPPFEVGTLGGFIAAKNRFYILSNAHVLTKDPFKLITTPARIVQPDCVSEHRTGQDVVAKVSYHTQLKDSPFRNKMDVALALVNSNITIMPTYEQIGNIMGYRDPIQGEKVFMVSATSGYHEAIIEKVDQHLARVNVLTKTADFVKQAEFKSKGLIGPSLKGDSGGIWIGEDKKACLLNFAGAYDDDQGRFKSVRRKPEPITLMWYSNDDNTPLGEDFLRDSKGEKIMSSKTTIEPIDTIGWGSPMTIVMEWVKQKLGPNANLI